MSHKLGGPKRSALLGLITRQERWGLSWRGWCALLLLGGLVCTVSFFWLHPFLAVSRPVDGQFLVIEGWVGNYALEAGIREFEARKYGRFFTTGGPMGDDGSTSAYRTLAEYAAARLKKLGAKPETIEPIQSARVIRNRTYASAVGLRNWFAERQIKVTAINVMTVGAHARRTRLMYEKAFGKGVQIGIIAIEDRAYDPKHWWESSAGVKEMLAEIVGYLYAKIFFHPSAVAESKTAQAGINAAIRPRLSMGAPRCKHSGREGRGGNQFPAVHFKRLCCEL